jgi:hypothetical protein
MEIRIIDTEEISKFFWSALVKLGYAPTEEECENLADICFDYLYELGIIEDYQEY